MMRPTTKVIYSLVFFFMMPWLSIAYAGQFEDGQAAYDQQDYKTALQLWMPLAEQGNADAQYNVGIMCDYGFGVRKNALQAIEWFRRAAVQGHAKAERHYNADNYALQLHLPPVEQTEKVADKHTVAVVAEASPKIIQARLANIEPSAGTVQPVPAKQQIPAAKQVSAADTSDVPELTALAEKGDVMAQLKLGNAYALAVNVSQDYELAAKWYAAAAAQGNANAQELLGELNNLGIGVPQNYVEAARLYKSAAEQGNAKAQSELATLYIYGHGVPQDYQAAMEWYTKAAAQGDVEAKAELGNLYAAGLGVQQDYQKAKEYYTQALQQGNTKVQAQLDALRIEEEESSKEDILEKVDLQKAMAGEKPVGADGLPQTTREVAESKDLSLAMKQGLDIGFEISTRYRYREKTGTADPFVNQSSKKAGIDAGYTYVPVPGYFGRIEGRISNGAVNYSSASGLANGEPVREWELRSLSGMDFDLHSFDMSPYLGFGVRSLYNDARGTTNLGSHGYRRQSYYFYLPLGLTERFRIGQLGRVATNIEYDLFAGGTQKSYLSDANPTLGNVLNHQFHGAGARGDIMLDVAGFSVGPWLDYWHISNSNIVPIPGMPGFGLQEPNNITKEIGFKVVKDFW